MTNQEAKAFAAKCEIEAQAMLDFAEQWELRQGRKPAPFQKAIALQGILRGQTTREIIESLTRPN